MLELLSAKKANFIIHMLSKESITLILLFTLILALVVGGYGLFIWFVINVMQGGAAFGLLFVAVIAGVASFFNPCAFPLLPVLMTSQNRLLKTQ